ncbi:hypothetical protein ASPBRDRAFT_40485 [Aspergillus brasiliensis CBS 101740]|uniref:Uncharacterized protein n=1 Tax=Aspergillus brasiliensis (strain CBS 101740 / IMI 381727 / IBT 21946) TaxID=767769 RepID=A0A1L9UTY3_ASPBC|nr:hypothetical protein ASPBRDRAFT_40485 [Aspergillus brasiliensis CBS 101740]
MFSVIIPDHPCLTDIVAVETQPNGQTTKFAFNFPLPPKLTELVVFFLPGTVLPPDTAAAIYIQFPDPNNNVPQFKFIGALANERPSAILKVDAPQIPGLQNGNAMAGTAPMVTLGISLEPVQAVAPQIAALEAEQAGGAGSSSSLELVRHTRQQKEMTTKVLAQRIIGNAFNFLASFASEDPSNKGQETVPLKTFRDWWTKFERKVEMDPTFLEREDPSATG